MHVTSKRKANTNIFARWHASPASLAHVLVLYGLALVGIRAHGVVGGWVGEWVGGCVGGHAPLTEASHTCDLTSPSTWQEHVWQSEVGARQFWLHKTIACQKPLSKNKQSPLSIYQPLASSKASMTFGGTAGASNVRHFK